MAPVQISLQVGKEKFQWQDGLEKCDDKEDKDIRKLLVLSKAVGWQTLQYHEDLKRNILSFQYFGAFRT
ncbi:hypothetical protein N7471_010676 [Penicillium samsonianum]|uniref:uncharacterized protein n=1 Tax=Penicillium samsonianum TaxID=1882272 RepID=UPI0025494130|nr:uncharacterized protein N7471_010676 [Penicillium samsonianum]KAJ6126183.1 hypothetical protein N7471_010676 [Penicillium samsonianum]